jgi:hypothetical protein
MATRDCRTPCDLDIQMSKNGDIDGREGTGIVFTCFLAIGKIIFAEQSQLLA